MTNRPSEWRLVVEGRNVARTGRVVARRRILGRVVLMLRMHGGRLAPVLAADTVKVEGET